MSFKSLLTQRCTISRRTIVKEEHGFTIPTWTTVNTDVYCRIDYITVSSPILNILSSGLSKNNDYQGFFLPNEDIETGDRITWNDIDMYAKPPNKIYGAKNKVHHLEVIFGLQEE